MWMLISGRIPPAVFAYVMARMLGAMAGRFPREAISLQDAALNLNP